MARLSKSEFGSKFWAGKFERLVAHSERDGGKEEGDILVLMVLPCIQVYPQP